MIEILLTKILYQKLLTLMNNYIPRVASGLTFISLAYAGFSNKPTFDTPQPTDHSEDVKTMLTLV
jgi:hypothetical protein